MSDIPEFYAILTEAGRALQFECMNSNKQFIMSEMAVGDGNGSYYEPEKTQLNLKNECYRHAITRKMTDKKGLVKSVILDIPEDIYGFTIREVGVFGENDELLLVGKYPATPKLKPESGAISQLAIKMNLTQINELVLPVLIDPSVNTASVQYVEEYFQKLGEKGKANGYASLGGNGKVPEEQLPDIDTQNMYTTGTVSNDTRGYNQLVEMAHSTFDKSKVTITGNPIITDDGIMSGFAAYNANYVTLLDDFSISGNNFEMTIGGTFNGLPTGNGNFSLFQIYEKNTDARIIVYQLKSNGYLQFGTYDGTNALYSNAIAPSDLTGDFQIKLRWNIGNNVSADLIQNNTVVGTMSKDFSYKFTNNARIREGYGLDGVFHGTLDLKQTQISLDKIPGYSCNKTGLDVVKPDDYTVVGSPTITDDGVVSGLSADNYLTIPSLDFSKPFEMSGTFITGADTLKEQCIFSGQITGANFMFGNHSNGNPIVYFPSTVTLNWRQINKALSPNTKYTYKLSFDGSQFTYNVTDGNSYNESITTTTLDTSKLSAVGTCYIGRSVSGNNPENELTIDLNTFKDYIEGDLVYQACLKIPYTESKTGSKIVDAVYRDRVEDVYEQYGTAMYYTLDGENKNFTLPMGEIYGMIEQDKNGLNNPFFFGMSLYSEVNPNNASWLLSNGQNNLKNQYSSYYNWILENVNKARKNFLGQMMYAWGSASGSYMTASLTPVVGSVVYQASSKKAVGHVTAVNTETNKISFIDEVSNQSYTNVGRYSASDESSSAYITDYDFVINTQNETFRLPLKNGRERLISNKFINLNLPTTNNQQYTASHNGLIQWNGIQTANNQYIKVINKTTNQTLETASPSSTGANTGSIEVKRGNIFTVQSNNLSIISSLKLLKAEGNGNLYFYVGETVQNADLINAGAIMETLALKADKTEIDGKWVIKEKQLLTLSDYNISSNFNVTYDLSDYLPNDNNIYECILGGSGTNNQNGRILSLYVGDFVNGHGGFFLKTGGTSVTYTQALISVLVYANRKLKIQSAGANSDTSAEIKLFRYRKVR